MYDKENDPADNATILSRGRIGGIEKNDLSKNMRSTGWGIRDRDVLGTRFSTSEIIKDTPSRNLVAEWLFECLPDAQQDYWRFSWNLTKFKTGISWVDYLVSVVTEFTNYDEGFDYLFSGD